MLRQFRVRRQKTLYQIFPCKAVNRALYGNHAIAHNGNMRCNLKYFRQAVRNIDDTDSFCLQIRNAAEQAFYLVKRQRGSRLVQYQELRMAQDTPQNFHQLLFRDGKAACLPAQIQIPANFPHRFDKFLMQLCLALRKADQNIFFHSHIGEQQRLLRNHVNTLCQRRSSAARLDNFLPVEQKFTLIMGIDAHNDLHQRGFSRAVAANQCQNFAMHNIHVDSLEHLI